MHITSYTNIKLPHLLQLIDILVVDSRGTKELQTAGR